MAEKGGNSDQSAGDDPSVLGSLPSTRPTRLSRRARTEEAVGDSPAAKAQAAAAKAPPAKPKAVKAPAKRKAPAKPKAVKPPARPEADEAPAPAAAGSARPQAIRAGHPTLSEPPAEPPSSTPGGVQAVKDVVRAAGGLAAAGLTLTEHVLKWVFARLPKP